MREYSIYQLVDPRDNTPRYVGLSSDVLGRFAQHIMQKDNKVKAEWIEELKQAGHLPRIQVLEANIPTISEARSKERQWIKHLQAAGARLTNLQTVVKRIPKHIDTVVEP